MALRAVPFALRAFQTPAAVPDEKSSFLLPLNDDKKRSLSSRQGALIAFRLIYFIIPRNSFTMQNQTSSTL